jgi:hypothetical protein
MKKLLQWVGVYFAMLIVLLVVEGFYYLVAGKWTESAFPMMFTLPLAFMAMAWWMSRNVKLSQPADIPVVRETLLGLGFKPVLVRILESSEHPKPICQPGSISIPVRVLSACSEDALRWTIKTEYSAVRMETKWTLIWFGIPLICSLVVIALIDRFHASYWWAAIPTGCLALSIVWLSGFSNRNLQEFDRMFTQTEADRSAAKEALSFPYFDQISRKPIQKWMYTAAAYRARAQNLGITLEEGYQVPGADRIRVVE